MSGAGAEFHINAFDAIVIGILCLSALVAFFRGFIRELLSLGAWVGAAIVTLYLFPHSTEFMKQHVKSTPTVAAGIGALGTYVAALIVISIINSIIIRYVKSGMEVGLLDNFLGLIFGSLRGMFIVSFGFLIITQAAISKDNPPDWLKTSVTKPYLQMGADALMKAAPKYLNDIEGVVNKERDKLQDNKDKDDSKDDSKDSGEEKGYQPGLQKDLNRLMNSTDPQGSGYNRGQ
jgi:membrane protein required for colicin V production